MPRRKKHNFDIEKQREELECRKDIGQEMLKDIKNQLGTKFPDNENAVHNIVATFASGINSEIENAILEYNSQASPVVSERELVMAIYDIKEGTQAYEDIDSYERDHRRIKELLKHDGLVKIMIDRGIRKKDKENYVRFIKKIVNNPDYKKNLSKAKKAREGQAIKIPEKMLDELLNLLDSVAENAEEKNLVQLRKEYIEELRKVAQSYQEVIEKLVYLTYFDCSRRLAVLKSYSSDLKKLNERLYEDLKKVEDDASKMEEVSLELIDYLYSE